MRSSLQVPRAGLNHLTCSTAVNKVPFSPGHAKPQARLVHFGT